MRRLGKMGGAAALIAALMGLGGCGGDEEARPPSALELDRMDFAREGPAPATSVDLVPRLAASIGLQPADTLAIRSLRYRRVWRLPLEGLDPACFDSLSLRVKAAAPTHVRISFSAPGERMERGAGPKLPIVGGSWQPVGLRLPSSLRTSPQLQEIIFHWPNTAPVIELAELRLHAPRGLRALCTVDGRTRPSLRLPAGGGLGWELDRPVEASLEMAWTAWKPGDGRLELVVEDDGEEIHRELVEEGRGWAERSLPPRRWRAPRLRLEGEAGRVFLATPRLRRDAEERENILLIVIDTLRADRLGCYGHPAATSPNLDAFAAGAWRFQQAWAPAPWTHPSTASLHSGLFPGQHGLGTTPGLFTGFQPGTPRLARELQRVGYATAAVSNNPIVSPDEDFGLGFDLFDQRAFEDHQTAGAERVTGAALQWLDQHRDGPFFLYLHYFDPHDPYWAPPEYRERFVRPVDRRFADLVPEGSVNKVQDQFARVQRRKAGRYGDLSRYLGALYDAEVAYCDHWIGVLLDELAARGLDETTTVLITSDHGEELLDHGGFKHAHSLYQELVRVPLLLRPADGREQGAVVTAPVNLVDVMPTLLRRARAEGPPLPLPGRDLVEIARDDPGPAGRSGWSVSFGSFFAAREAAYQPRRAALDWPFKLIHNQQPGTFELYDLSADPNERENLAARHPGVVESLAAQADSVLRRRSPLGEGTMTPQLRQKLESIGYVD